MPCSARFQQTLVIILGMLLSSGMDAALAQEKVEAPDVFEKSTPASIKDLREIQDHVTKLVEKLKPCTVSLQIGGAQGSGVIVSADGLILTAAHVSGSPGRTVRVTTDDGHTYLGKTLGRNTVLDASMIQITSDENVWPFRPVSSEEPGPGDWCLTLGHPGGLQADRGVVLRLGRVIFENPWLIQTDCELIGGDSGGPLFDMQGQVIGINTRIGENTEFNFHVPASAYLSDWDRLKNGEDFRANSGAQLGVTVVETENRIGMTVTDLAENGPADRAGLEKGDLLLKFQNKTVNSLDSLREMVGEELPGKTIKVEVLREGETKEFRIRLGMKWE